MDRITLHGQAQGYVENPTDADYAAAARWALQEKNLPLAVQQVSAAIAMNPLHAPHLRLLDQVVAAARGPLLLVQLPKGSVFFGLCAARARVLARLGRLDDALRHLFEATAFSPSTPFVSWAREWVHSARNARCVSPDVLVGGVVSLTDALRGEELDDGAAANLEAALHVVDRVWEEQSASASLRIAASRALRLLGRRDEALLRLGDASGWEIAVERAAIHREFGDREAHVAALLQAAEARPDEATTYVDLGDAHLDGGRPEEAVTAYERALSLDASSRWARVSAAYARVLAGGPREFEAPGAPERAPGLEDRERLLEADLSAYVERIGDPIDPVVGVIRGVAAHAPMTAPDKHIVVRVRTARPLAPSAGLAFLQMLARCGRQGRLVVDHEGAEGAFGPLWRVEREGAVPAVERPPEALLYMVSELARAPFGWGAWRARAADLSTRAPAWNSEALLHAMAHPPQAPAEMDPVRWVHGYQVAAALLVAAGSTPIEEREQRLSTLLRAVDDWSTAAALLGLRALGRRNPALIERLHALVPREGEALPPLSRALAITGAELAGGGARRDFLRLRARVRLELARVSGEPSRD